MVCSSGRRPTDRRGCCLEVDELRHTRSSQSPGPRPTRDEDAYLVTSERLRVLELDALARLADVRRRDETEQDGRSQ
jgi:hypothetical protein